MWIREHDPSGGEYWKAVVSAGSESLCFLCSHIWKYHPTRTRDLERVIPVPRQNMDGFQFACWFFSADVCFSWWCPLKHFFFFDTNDRILVILYQELQFSNFLPYINDRNNSSALWDQWRRLVMKLKSAIIKDKNKVLQFTYVRILTSWRCTILCCFFINCDWIN